MSYYLDNARGHDFAWNFAGWPRVLTLANAYGWRPRDLDGRPQRLSEFLGNFDDRVVLAANATSLAAAIRRVLQDDPDGNRPIQIPTRGEPIALGGWGTAGRRKLTAFAAFCEEGEFFIN